MCFLTEPKDRARPQTLIVSRPPVSNLNFGQVVLQNRHGLHGFWPPCSGPFDSIAADREKKKGAQRIAGRLSYRILNGPGYLPFFFAGFFAFFAIARSPSIIYSSGAESAARSSRPLPLVYERWTGESRRFGGKLDNTS